MWEWMVACLRKGKEKGPYSHLAEQVTRYDVAGLFIAITESVDLQHPYIFWNGFEEFVNSRPEKGEDIFAYFVRLDKMVENLTIRTAGHMMTLTNITPVSELAVKLKMFAAASYYPEYKSFLNKMQTKKPAVWLSYSKQTIIEELRTIYDNSLAMGKPIVANQVQQDRRGRARSRAPEAKRARSRSSKPDGCPQGVCWQFWQSGKCDFQADGRKCNFKHEKAHKGATQFGQQQQQPQQRQQQQQPQQQQQQQQQKPAMANSSHGEQKRGKCGKCGSQNHSQDKCTFQGECHNCKKQGHTAEMCRNKNRQSKPKPRGNLSVAMEEPQRVPAVEDEVY